MKDYQTIIAMTTAILTSIIGPIAVHYITKLMADKKTDILSAALEINSVVTEKLDIVKKETEADRIWLLQFHNGGNFYPTGKSIQKFSMGYELLNSDSVPCQSQFQNIPVSLFSKQIHSLHKGVVISVADTTIGETKYAGFTSVIVGSGVKSTYIFPVYNIKGDLVAIVGLDYNTKKIELDQSKLINIELEVSTIGGVLGNYLSS